MVNLCKVDNPGTNSRAESARNELIDLEELADEDLTSL
jgi:hypothetical protein